ncbi:MAG: ammonia channel protein, partial [Bacteroidota bacterium]|nr:ammonia channel protein [Bacteroidota bacterium]
MVAIVKQKMGYDDSLDAFGVHGIGGIVGAVLTGVFATPAVQAAYSGLLFGNVHQFLVQLIAVSVTFVYSGVMTLILYLVVEKLVGLRANKQEEAIGLDETMHNETAYTIID